MSSRVAVEIVQDYLNLKAGTVVDVPPHMVNKLRALGVVAGDVDRRRAVADLTVKELKEKLAARGLAVSGNKDELIERLKGAGQPQE